MSDYVGHWLHHAQVSLLTGATGNQIVESHPKKKTWCGLLGKADASALASLLSTVDGLDTPLEVDTKIANALGLATEAFVAAQLAITALQGAKADTARSYATNAALSASETALQSALDAILAELAAAFRQRSC